MAGLYESAKTKKNGKASERPKLPQGARNGSREVIDYVTIRFPICYFLQVLHRIQVSISSRFEIFGSNTLTNEHTNKHTK